VFRDSDNISIKTTSNQDSRTTCGLDMVCMYVCMYVFAGFLHTWRQCDGLWPATRSRAFV